MMGILDIDVNDINSVDSSDSNGLSDSRLPQKNNPGPTGFRAAVYQNLLRGGIFPVFTFYSQISVIPSCMISYGDGSSLPVRLQEKIKKK